MLRGPRTGGSLATLLTRALPVALALTTALRTAPARADGDHGDRVAELGKMLASSSSEKERLSAVTSLARLGDKRALKPLVDALHDPSALVRAVAATGLGHLGHRAALPSLRVAVDDADEQVRNRAREAVVAVARANNVPAGLPAAPGAEPETVAPTTAARHGQAGFGRQPHAVEARPDLFVLINSSNDDSPGKTDKATRKVHGELLRKVLVDSFHNTPLVTSVAADAQRYGLDPRHLDVSVTRLEVVPSGTYMEIHAELRLAISDRNGKMMSFLSGGAKVQIPKRTYDPRYLPDLRKEALENAVKGLFDKLLAHLRHPSQS